MTPVPHRLTLWRPDRPLTTGDARAIDARLQDGDAGDLATDPALARCRAELAGDDCWLAPPAVLDDRALVLVLSSGAAGALGQRIAARADAHRLVLFDPQADRLLWPVPFPFEGLVLELGDGSLLPTPRAETLAAIARDLVPGEHAILRRGEGCYVQALVDPAGAWSLECRQGSADTHLACAADGLGPDLVREVFVAYAAADDDRWRRLTAWRRLRL